MSNVPHGVVEGHPHHLDVEVYGIAGEMAAEGDPGPGSFRTRLIDALDEITPERVRQQARLVVE